MRNCSSSNNRLIKVSCNSQRYQSRTTAAIRKVIVGPSRPGLFADVTNPHQLILPRQCPNSISFLNRPIKIKQGHRSKHRSYRSRSTINSRPRHSKCIPPLNSNPQPALLVPTPRRPSLKLRQDRVDLITGVRLINSTMATPEWVQETVQARTLRFL